jgi:hypothetical protein
MVRVKKVICVLFSIEKDIKSDEDNNKTQIVDTTGADRQLEEIETEPHHEIVSLADHTMAAVFIKKYYGPFLLHPITKIIVAILFAIYLAIGIYGMTQVKSHI